MLLVKMSVMKVTFFFYMGTRKEKRFLSKAKKVYVVQSIKISSPSSPRIDKLCNKIGVMTPFKR